MYILITDISRLFFSRQYTDGIGPRPRPAAEEQIKAKLDATADATAAALVAKTDAD